MEESKESYGLNPEHKSDKEPIKGEFNIDILKEELHNFYNNPNTKPKKTREPSIKHNTWEEDGQRYSAWTIDNGSTIMITGDASMEQLSNTMKEDAEKWIKNYTEEEGKLEI